MSVDIRLPQINAATPEEQLMQIRRYLYQFAEQMKWAFANLDTGSDAVVLQNTTKPISNVAADAQAQTSFNEIKSLIIKSADIVNAFSVKIEQMLVGKYEALSETYGTFKQETQQFITNTSEYNLNEFVSNQVLHETVSGLEAKITAVNDNGYIKTGVLEYADDGSAIIGVAVGQTTEITTDGVTTKTFNKLARFTANGLELFDTTDDVNPVAYIKTNKLYITEAVVTEKIKVGGYEITTNNGLAFKWKGRDTD